MSYYSGLLELDGNDQPIVPELVLGTRSGIKKGVIQANNTLVTHFDMNNPAEFSLDVYKYKNDRKIPLWDEIKNLRTIYIPSFNRWYEITVTVDDVDNTVKHLSGTQLQQAELSQLMIYGVNINTEEDTQYDGIPTLFFDPENPDKSLLHRVLHDKASHYSIYHVDDTLKSVQRIFSFDGTSVYDALIQIGQEVHCLFLFGEWKKADGEIHRTISAYDLDDFCMDCGERGDFADGICSECGSSRIIKRYGEDSGVFINKENLGDNIQLTTDVDSIKNCFKLIAGDDDMTAAVMECNPNGSDYIWNISEEMLADMTPELRQKIRDFRAKVQYFEKEYPMVGIHSNSVENVNGLIRQYMEYGQDLETIMYPINGTVSLTKANYLTQDFDLFLRSTMMPNSPDVIDTTASQQFDNLRPYLTDIGVYNLQELTLTAAENAIDNLTKIYVDTSVYGVNLKLDSYVNGQWRGTITITSYTNESDTYAEDVLIYFKESSADYVQQQIDYLLKQSKIRDLDVPTVYKMTVENFKTQIKRYCLDVLKQFDDAAIAVLDQLAENNIGHSDNELYDKMYRPAYQKKQAIDEEIAKREAELATVKILQDEINAQKEFNRKELDLYTYLTNTINITDRHYENLTDRHGEELLLQNHGEQLWAELQLYRRDGEYSNSNYISTGLTSTQIVDKAQEFYKAAKKEILKASTPQHTLSCDLKDLLLAIPDEWKQHMYKFQLGNWLRLEADEKIYKLRLISFRVSYSALTSIDVDFSDATVVGDSVSDTKSILQAAQAMTTSYSATVQQADLGMQAKRMLEDVRTNGINLNQNKLVTSDKQSITMDKHGLLLRRQKVNNNSEFEPEQTKVINNGIYYTTDNWKTVKNGLGRFQYFDPKSGEMKDGFGVIADTVVGNLILGNDLGIYAKNGSMSMDENGFAVTATPEKDNSGLFSVQKENGDGTVTKFIYTDREGNVYIDGSSINIGKETIIEYLDSSVEQKGTTLFFSLSTEYRGVSTDYNGENGNYAGCSTTVKVLKGNTEDVTDSCTIVCEPREGIEGVYDNLTYTYTVSNLTTDIGHVDFTITRGTISVKKTFTLEKIKDGKPGKKGEDTISVDIVSDNGNIFRSKDFTAILTCKVYKGTQDITDQVISFHWVKKKADGTIDTEWGRATSGQNLIVTANDIQQGRAVFECEVTY